MSSYQNVSSDGTTVTLGLNGNPAISYTTAGAQFTKNKLINGEVTRINQRTFNGTWSGKSVWETQPATIAGKEAAYGYDMWFRSNAARSDGTGASENMAQWIEAGNFRPSTVHTLSGTGVTTTNITSPASGDWKIVVAQGATNVQVEEGNVATSFELRDITHETMQCKRYFRPFVASGTTVSSSNAVGYMDISPEMRTSGYALTLSAAANDSVGGVTGLSFSNNTSSTSYWLRLVFSYSASGSSGSPAYCYGFLSAVI